MPGFRHEGTIKGKALILSDIFTDEQIAHLKEKYEKAKSESDKVNGMDISLMDSNENDE